ncbi:hypothetical protein M427DRAFT_291790 [Gonapodya prolifera JEL478]|uniref:Uncharacterized protein n=1 Tax=Gonapodya prolifera (strain JEL478) TaxID=1344416 RepID=A0A139AIK0_GONPJ|nr:hypothetical protein M427DRAFT_291790 [Gonapodya prolifera JEL478]|eukprot:KXS16529.1 hypothetical protein M427DRAFT_291790 [Gonapodya prolifera JEL478]
MSHHVKTVDTAQLEEGRLIDSSDSIKSSTRSSVSSWFNPWRIMCTIIFLSILRGLRRVHGPALGCLSFWIAVAALSFKTFPQLDAVNAPNRPRSLFAALDPLRC